MGLAIQSPKMRRLRDGLEMESGRGKVVLAV